MQKDLFPDTTFLRAAPSIISRPRSSSRDDPAQKETQSEEPDMHSHSGVSALSAAVRMGAEREGELAVTASAMILSDSARELVRNRIDPADANLTAVGRNPAWMRPYSAGPASSALNAGAAYTALLTKYGIKSSFFGVAPPASSVYSISPSHKLQNFKSYSFGAQLINSNGDKQ
jgi:hypothetical protein